MKITEEVESQVSPQKVWSTWRASNYWDLDKSSFTQGQKGRVVSGKKRGPAFVVSAIEEGESFTLSWKAPMVKFDMRHEVFPTATGSKLVYTMTLRGLMAYPMRFLLGRKIKRTLRETLQAFVKHVE
ncbi:MAG: hypothetical protein SNF33_07725 [Candidatus Algichlamydia australiensis]|nr:hypothetical protein [Chlamydiales bacterium]